MRIGPIWIWVMAVAYAVTASGGQSLPMTLRPTHQAEVSRQDLPPLTLGLKSLLAPGNSESAPISGNDPSQDRFGSAFTVVAGDLRTARRVAIVVQSQDALSPGKAPPPYDATLSIRVATNGSDPSREGSRLRNAFDQVSGSGVAFDVWSEGLAALIVRQAIEHVRPERSPIRRVVLIDAPNRGVSPSGWPNWPLGVTTRVPGFAVSGSSFLVALNATPMTALAGLEYVNVWRDQTHPSPRATVMQLPRPALLVVVRPQSFDSIWTVLNSSVIAVKRVSESATRAPLKNANSVSQEELTKGKLPRLDTSASPSFADLLNGAMSEKGRDSVSWVAFDRGFMAGQSPRPPPEDPFSHMTDVVSVGYDPQSHRLIVIGYEDFSRDVLKSDFFFTALRSFQQTYPAISIDPPSTNDPRGQAPVRFVGATQGTYLGGLMFEADRVMKTLGLGKDNITQVPVGSGVPGYRSLAGNVNSQDTAAEQTVWRLWFEPEKWHAIEDSSLTARLETRLRCRWEKMTPNYAPSQSVINFSQHLTQQLRLYSVEQPSFDQLDQASVLVAAARWAYEANLEVIGLPTPKATTVGTPRYTPVVQVESSSVSGSYRVTQILQGGVILGPPLRHVRNDGSRAGALMARALQGIPELQPGVATHVPRSPNQAGSTATPPAHLPRPPTVSWQYNDNGYLLTAVSFTAEHRIPSIPIGIQNASDRFSDAAYPSDKIIIKSFPVQQPAITNVVMDDAAQPPQVILTGLQFGTEGSALFNGKPIRTAKWTPDEVVVILPNTTGEGTLVLRSGNHESNAVRFVSVPGSVVQEPPRINFRNNAQYALRVEIHSSAGGSLRTFDLAPGAGSTTRVLPGRYTITARAGGELILNAASSQDAMYERGHEYSITYSANSFQLGELIVDNQTGAPLTLSVGTQTTTVPIGGRSTVRLPFGSYRMGVTTKCGSANENVTISPGSVPILTYGCKIVYH